MKLPELPIKIQNSESQIYHLSGINKSDDHSEGSLYDTKNISSIRFPFFTTRKDRSILGTYSEVTDIAAWNKLVIVNGTELLYDGAKVGDVTSGEKQFAVVNTKIVIMPDKKYLDLNTKQLVDMAANITIEGTITTTKPSDSDTTQVMTIPNGYSTYSEAFSALNKGDALIVTLGTTVFNGLIYQGISNSSGNLVVTFQKSKKYAFSNATYSGGSLQRKIPDFDFICDSDNRIWGCVNSEQTIYCSALGDPTNYFDYSGESTDSYAVAVGSEGNFTGCAKLGSSVVFFKEYCIHKVIGSYPAEFAMYTYKMDGVKQGCSRSLISINDNLFYLSNNGVMTFSGGATSNISEELGKIAYSNGVAGTDGERYYLSCNDGNDNLFTYDLKTGIWLREDDKRISAFARLNNTLYMLIDGKIYSSNSLPLNDDWYMEFNPIYESNYNNYGRRVGTVFGKKYYSKLILRVEQGENTYAVIKIKCDNGRWVEVGKITGKKEGVFVHTIPLNRCDKFSMRIEGHGEFTLHEMAREYAVRSVRNE